MPPSINILGFWDTIWVARKSFQHFERSEAMSPGRDGLMVAPDFNPGFKIVNNTRSPVRTDLG